MKYIETLREGERIAGVYLCKFCQQALTKNGKAYLNVILQDRTGTIDAKVWDPNSQGIDDFEALDYIDVMGDVTSFMNALQVNVKRVRKAREGEYDPKDYLPVSSKDIEQMYEDLKKYIAKIQNPYLQELTASYYLRDEDFIRRFKFQSAAKTVHHGFVGGLLEHTLSVTKMCDYFADNYPILNRDLLLTAAIFHDIGKTEELSAFPENDYTDAGQLLGPYHDRRGDGGRADPPDSGFPGKAGQRAKTLYSSSSRRTGIRFSEETRPGRGTGTEFRR